MRTALLAIVLVCVTSFSARAAEKAAKDKEPVDKAVERALEFLAATQDKTDGSWKMNNVHSPAVTSLAVMAFLSAGHVPGEGKYGAAVEKGVRWLLKQQQPNGLIATDNGHEM